MDWTLTKIRAKVRKVAARPDEGAITTTDLDEYINHYYQNIFPLEALPPELIEWFTQNTATGVDTYAVDEKNLAFKEPFTLAGWPINYYLNVKNFYDLFPETQSYGNNRSTDVLFFGQNLIFRPPPDTIYQFKARTILRPDALTLITDKPPNQLWGPIIAYGAAIDIKTDNGEFEEIDSLKGFYDFYLNLIKRQEAINSGTQRSIPRF